MNERREIHYQGRVQGVGFRYTAAQIARGHEVAGFVRNLPDGRVHVIVEGESSAVAGFLDELAETMRGNIRSTSVDVRPATGEFVDFDIRH